EVGYHTTAGDALARLEQAGFTRDVAGRAAETFRPAAMRAYARGPAARKAIAAGSASEIFDGYLYDAGARYYEGLTVDLPAVSAALEIRHAPVVFQGIALSCMLRDLQPETMVTLSTIELMSTRRPGERSYRRIVFRDLEEVIGALGALARHTPPPREIYPTR